VTAEDGVTVNYYKIVVTVRATSTDATLAYGVVKDTTVDLGTPNSDISSIVDGAISISSTQAVDGTGSLATYFSTTDSTGATMKYVKYATN
jgi:hypothetical protein